MFEAVFNIIALVESNGPGERLFKVFEHGAPVNDSAFSSLMTNAYQQDVYRMLRTGDTLEVTMHLDTPPREISRTVQFREDQQFVGDGIQQPTPELRPLLSTLYEQFSQQVVPGDVIRITFHVQRP
jgi:hypothetical protein